jgi:hypothetical protein
MDPFGASPAQPGSVINSIFGGQTPSSNMNLLNNSNLNGPNSAFNPHSVHGGSNLQMFAPGSLGGNPGSVFSVLPSSFMQIGGPGSVLGSSFSGPGPSSVLNNQINSIGGPGKFHGIFIFNYFRFRFHSEQQQRARFHHEQ